MIVESMNNRIKALKYELEVLNGLNYLDVVYETDLADNNKWNESMERIFKFLGVPPVGVSSKTLKTENISNEERILNYSEILEYLKKSEHKYSV